VRARCLSFHAAYRCRHSGECCRAGWDVEVEPHIVDAVTTGRVLPVVSTPLPFEPLADGTGIAPARSSSGDCAFHHNHRCSLQERGSESMLPSACRHFPRVFLRDARGILVTLSHFCPTAASLLFDNGPAEVVDAPSTLMLSEPIEGLDAREALPPLVRPNLLADIEGYAAWEERVVRTLLEVPDAEQALARIEHATERVRRWTPASGALTRTVDEAFGAAQATAAVPLPLSPAFDLVHQLTGPHPLLETPPTFANDWCRLHDAVGGALTRPVGRYLAASAFGNWIAYRGQGLRSVVSWLQACYDVLRVQVVRHLDASGGRVTPADLMVPVRMADYIMVHTVDSLAFGRAAVSFER
jgi:hypothetical protein